MRGKQLCVLGLGRLTGICCNEVMQFLVNDTTVLLICDVADCGTRDVDSRFANP